MHVLISGATGLIGQKLIARLLRDGHQVEAWVRDATRARALLGAQVALVGGPVDGPALREAVARAEGIVNLAGAPVFGGRWSGARRALLVDSRVGLTSQLVEAMRLAGQPPRVLVSASAVGYYGDRGDAELDESSPPGDDFLAELCRLWEQAARSAEALGVRVVLPRIGLVLDPDGGALGKLLPIFRAGAGGRLGSGRQYMPWIHIDDLLEILVRALEAPDWQGPINATAPLPVTNRAFTRSLARALRRPALLPVPGLALRTLFGEAAGTLLGGQRTRPAALQALGFSFRYRELDRALEDLLG